MHPSPWPLGVLSHPWFLGFTIHLFMGNICLQKIETHLARLKQKGNLLERQTLGQEGHLGLCPALSTPPMRHQGVKD